MLWLFRCRRWVWYWLMRLLFWRSAASPSRMLRCGRPLDNEFSPDELLYLRCQFAWLDVNRRLKPANVHFPDQSTNREKFCAAYDVLLPTTVPNSHQWLCWGVVAIRVSDVPTHAETTGGTEMTFTVEHDPIEDNYGHTELRAYKNGRRERNKNKINDLVKKAYRTKFAEGTRIVVRPLV